MDYGKLKAILRNNWIGIANGITKSLKPLARTPRFTRKIKPGNRPDRAKGKPSPLRNYESNGTTKMQSTNWVSSIQNPVLNLLNPMVTKSPGKL
jgi:hypothetical protein